MSRQDQRVATGGQAIQAEGDVNIQSGITAGQIVEIIDSLGALVQKGEDRALILIEQRLHDFKQSLMNEFAKPENGGDAEAFREPDFQFVINQAQIGHARRGDDELKDELVKLLIQRSALDTGTRKAMILNEAIITAASLTKDEYACLAAVFLVKDVLIGGVRAADTILAIKDYISGFVDDVPEESHSIEYLESMRCLSLSLLNAHKFWGGLHSQYGHRLSKGVSIAELESIVKGSSAGAETFTGLIVHMHPEINGSVIFLSRNETVLRESLQGRCDPEMIEKLVAAYQASIPTEAEFRDRMVAEIPDLAKLEAVWSSTRLNQAVLTALGKALAHSVLTSKTTFATSLEIWVQ